MRTPNPRVAIAIWVGLNLHTSAKRKTDEAKEKSEEQQTKPLLTSHAVLLYGEWSFQVAKRFAAAFARRESTRSTWEGVHRVAPRAVGIPRPVSARANPFQAGHTCAAQFLDDGLNIQGTLALSSDHKPIASGGGV